LLVFLFCIKKWYNKKTKKNFLLIPINILKTKMKNRIKRSVFLLILFAPIFFVTTVHAKSQNLQTKYIPNEVVIVYSNDSESVQKAKQKIVRENIRGIQKEKEIFAKEITTELRTKTKDSSLLIETNILFQKQKKGVRFLNKNSKSGMILIIAKSTIHSTKEMISLLQNEPNILSIEPNHLHKVMNETAEDLYHIYTNSSGAGINADKAWEKGITGNEVVIAILDTGIFLNHTDLSKNIWKNTAETSCNNGKDDDNNGFIDDCFGWDIQSNDNNPNPDGNNSHGTHAAGIAMAVRNNNGVVGVAPGAKAMPVKVFGAGGGGRITDIIKGMDYAVQNGAHIISLSLGASIRCPNSFKNASKAAHDAGVMVIAASGNSGSETPASPASCPNVFGVGATDSRKNIASFSQYWEDMVDAVTPGTNILSTIPSGYKKLSGTSMATPVVSGLAALVKSTNMSMGPDQISKILCDNAEDIGDTGRDKKSGCGFLNAEVIINAISVTLQEIAINPETQNIKVGETPSIITASGGTNEYSFDLDPGDTGISLENCPGGTTPTCQLNSPTAEGTATLTITSDTETSTATIIVTAVDDLPPPPPSLPGEIPESDDNNDNDDDNNDDDNNTIGRILELTPPSQTIPIGCAPETLTASGGNGEYRYRVFGRKTGITAVSCDTGNTCTLSEAKQSGTFVVVVRSGKKLDFARIRVNNQVYRPSSENNDIEFEMKHWNKKQKNWWQLSMNKAKEKGDLLECVLGCLSNDETKMHSCLLECLNNNGNNGSIECPGDGTSSPPPPLALPEPITTLTPTPEDETDSLPTPPPPPLPMSDEKNCSVNLTSFVSDTIDWSDVYIVQGSDGSAWKRAIITNPQNTLEIQEGEPTKIIGIAKPNTEVQIFLYKGNNTLKDRIDAPAMGTCFNANIADDFGNFVFYADASVLWNSIGDKIVIDAFFKLERSWDELADSEKNSPAPILPRITKVTGEKGDESCTEICDIGTIEGIVLDPSVFSAELLGKNFNTVGGNIVIIGRFPGPHTFSAKIKDHPDSDPESLKSILQKSLLLELFKRALLGNRNANGETPGISALTTNALRKVMDNQNEYSQRTKDLVKYSREIMLHSDQERNQAITSLEKIFANIQNTTTNDTLLPPQMEISIAELFNEIFPKNISKETTWAGDFLEIMNFWTGSLRPNTCLMAEDREMYKNFTPMNMTANKCSMTYFFPI
jgi:subtilisin family serine protease